MEQSLLEIDLKKDLGEIMELLRRADNLIARAQYDAPTDMPNYEYWRADYRKFLEEE